VRIRTSTQAISWKIMVLVTQIKIAVDKKITPPLPFERQLKACTHTTTEETRIHDPIKYIKFLI